MNDKEVGGVKLVIESGEKFTFEEIVLIMSDNKR